MKTIDKIATFFGYSTDQLVKTTDEDVVDKLVKAYEKDDFGLLHTLGYEVGKGCKEVKPLPPVKFGPSKILTEPPAEYLPLFDTPHPSDNRGYIEPLADKMYSFKQDLDDVYSHGRISPGTHEFIVRCVHEILDHLWR